MAEISIYDVSMYDLLNKVGDYNGNSGDSLLRILYGHYIDERNIGRLNVLIQDLSNNYAALSSTFTKFCEKLSDTGSQRFSTSAKATQHIDRVNSIKTTLDSLEKLISTLKDKDVEGNIKSYNDILKQLKPAAKAQVVIRIAKEVNACAERGDSKYLKSTYEGKITKDYPQDHADFGVDRYYKYYNISSKYVASTPSPYASSGGPSYSTSPSCSENDLDLAGIISPGSSSTAPPSQSSSGGHTEYSSTEKSFVYFQYWGWIDSDEWPFTILDWSEEKIAQKFMENDIPYDRSRYYGC